MTGSNGTSPPERNGASAAGRSLRRWVPGAGWQRRAQPGEPRRRRRRQQRLVLGALGVACLLGAWSVAFSESVPSIEPTIADERFVRAANDVCRPVQERLVDRAGGSNDEGSDAERAAAVSEVVSALDAMVADLGALRPATADQREVERWLGAWRGVLESGRATAASLREGDGESVEDAADAGQAPARAVNRFAQANGLRWCATRFG